MLLPSKHSSWWRRLEDVLKTSFVFVFRRHLQDVLIKTNMFALGLRIQKTSPRRLQDVLVKTNIFILAICLQDVFKTSSRPLQGVFKTYHQVNLFFLTRLREVFNTFLSTEEFAQVTLLLRNLWSVYKICMVFLCGNTYLFRFFKNGVMRNFTELTRKHLCRNPFFR